MNQIIDTLTKLVGQVWVPLAITIGGLTVFFLLAWIIWARMGDFVRFSKGCKLVASGKIENGLAKLKSGSVEMSIDKPSSLSYEKLVVAPFGYSALRAFWIVMFVVTNAATFAALMLSLHFYNGVVNLDTIFNVAVTMIYGSVLILFALGIARSAYKRATARYQEMICKINEEKILGEPADETDELLPTTIALWKKINEVAQNNENSFDTLNQLYVLLKQESKKPQTRANAEKLREAGNLLNSIILPHA